MLELIVKSFVLVLVSSCTLSLEVPRDADVRCDRPEACPADRTCLVELGLCVLKSSSCVAEVDRAYQPVADGNLCELDGAARAICRGGLCVASECGDGFVDAAAGEGCDLGLENEDLPDAACRTDCSARRCGDGVVDSVEACDDGNDTNEDGCKNDCTANVCGDGILNVGVEECDDANDTDQDHCTRGCRANVCGDGILNLATGGEACDDANDNPNDGCDACKRTRWAVEQVLGLGPAQGDAMRFGGNFGDLAVDRRSRLLVDAGALYVFEEEGGLLAPLTANLGMNGFAADGFGNVYYAYNGGYVRRWSSEDGSVTPIAGAAYTCQDADMAPVYCGDGGNATAAKFRGLWSVALDGMGNVYTGEEGAASGNGGRVRKISAATGLIDTLVGGGGDTADCVCPEQAKLANVYSVAWRNDVIVFTDVDHGDGALNRVRAVRLDVACDPTPPCGLDKGVVVTLAGGGTNVGGEHIAATDAELQYPARVAVSGAGDVFFVEYDGWRVRRVQLGDAGAPDHGHITTLATTVDDPIGVAASDDGTAYAADQDRLYRFAPPDYATEVIGRHWSDRDLVHDGGLALAARVSTSTLVVDSDGALLVGDGNGARLRRLVPGPLDQPSEATIHALVGDGDESGPVTGPAAEVGEIRFAGLAVHPTSGDIYFGDNKTSTIRRVRRPDPANSSTWVVEGVAGSGAEVFEPDHAPVAAADATFYELSDMAFDGDGRLYFVDNDGSSAGIVRRIDFVDPASPATWTVTTVAGGGSTSPGDGGPAQSAVLGYCYSLTIDRLDQVYVGVSGAVRRITFADPADATSGAIERVAGGGSDTGDGIAALSARIDSPWSLAFDGDDRLLISDTGSPRVRMVTFTDLGDAASGAIGTFAGVHGGWGLRGDGGPAASATVSGTYALAVDGDGNVYLGQQSWIRRVRGDDGTIDTIAGQLDSFHLSPLGTGYLVEPTALAKGTLAGQPVVLSTDAAHSPFTGQPRGKVRALDFIADRGTLLVGHPFSIYDNAGPTAWKSELVHKPSGVAFDPAGVVFVADVERDVLLGATIGSSGSPDDWTITLHAGALDSPGFADGALAAARFQDPTGLAFDAPRDLLYVADTGNHVVRVIDPAAGTVATLVGTPHERGNVADGFTAAQALLDAPEGVAVSAAGDLYVADTGNHRVLRVVAVAGEVDRDSPVETVIGDGLPSSAGAGAPARLFGVDSPRGLAFDDYGNLFITSRTAVREIGAGADGIADGRDTVGLVYGLPPRASFPELATNCLAAVLVTASAAQDELLAADTCQPMIVHLRRVPAP